MKKTNIIQRTNCSLLKSYFAKVLIGLAIVFTHSSCNNFLDIMPDNVATIDHAFSNAVEAEKYLFTCYSYLPGEGSTQGNVGMLSGDELWIPEHHGFPAGTWVNIARGYQNKNEPEANYWDGFAGGSPLFKAIRDCNIFLENVENLNKVRDLPLNKRTRWIAEVKFLKAYYHYYLLRMYGPIPIVDKNISISTPPAGVHVKRMPIDDCVDYIVALLDESVEDLPIVIIRTNEELGRITKPISLAIKAKVLLLAASPLFNGNSDYADFKDKDGVLLFNPTKDEEKWRKAANAAKSAIDMAEEAGHELFYLTNPPFTLTETSITQMSIRNAVCDRWNKETVWGLSNSRANQIQAACIPLLNKDMGASLAHASFAPPLKIVQQFYSKNGVPIHEDKTLDFSDYKQIREATSEENINIETGYRTARINFDREDRFYANIGFDGGRWLMADIPSRTDVDAYVLKAKAGQLGAGSAFGRFSETGYYTKKLVHWESIFEANSIGSKEYPWPAIRLADVYLMYAEALNETEGPVDDVHKYINLIRERAGLKSISDSWSAYSTNPSKPSTKDGMRAIIHQERLIELAFEGSRFWDLRRWKKAVEELNAPITGWTIAEAGTTAYYQTRTVFQQKFIAPRDYFWPIRAVELSVNPNLVQNPGW